jgi:hypothetical protein
MCCGRSYDDAALPKHPSEYNQSLLDWLYVSCAMLVTDCLQGLGDLCSTDSHAIVFLTPHAHGHDIILG